MITWFVMQETVRLPLPDGQFVDVKKRLTLGEREDMLARMTLSMTAGDKVQLNPREVRTARVLAYVVGWSLIHHGTPVPMSPSLPESERNDTFRAMSPEAFDLIANALDDHITAMNEERMDEKKTLTGERVCSAV